MLIEHRGKTKSRRGGSRDDLPWSQREGSWTLLDTTAEVEWFESLHPHSQRGSSSEKPERAQVERWRKPEVVGSNPASRSLQFFYNISQP